MMSNKLWTVGLHTMFGFLLVFGVLRAWADGRLDARALGLSIALAVVYTGFAIFGSRTITRPVPTTLWLAALCLLWIGLMVHAQDFMWLEFPLVFVFIHALPFWPGIVASVVLWAVAAFVPAWIHPQFWTAAAAIGPFIGTCFAVAVYHAARRVQAEAAHHAAVAKQLRETQEELAASEHQAGRLEERERLSREIHDTVAQGLSSIQLLLHSVESRMKSAPTQHDQTSVDSLQLARKVAADNLAETRRIIAALQPAPLEGADLSGALEKVCSSTVLGDAVSFCVDGTPTRLPATVEATIIRVAQASLANVVKHAHATRCRVTLTYQPDEVLLDCVDNGIGFDPTAPTNDDSVGIANARRRVEKLGGTFTIESEPGRGCGVSVSIPHELAS